MVNRVCITNGSEKKKAPLAGSAVEKKNVASRIERCGGCAAVTAARESDNL